MTAQIFLKPEYDKKLLIDNVDDSDSLFRDMSSEMTHDQSETTASATEASFMVSD